MQDGLHIGLAAWINDQRQSGSFTVYPSLAHDIEAVNLDAIQDVLEVAQAVEFSKLTNFIPRQDRFADTFNTTEALWKVHKTNLDNMNHALEAWNEEEQAEYDAAREILYLVDESGLPVPSQKHLLYEELRNAYQDLCISGGDPDEIAQAMANWMALGYKLIVENAFAAMVRLSGKSSSTQAYNEALMLMENPQGPGLGFSEKGLFAPVYFAPISAKIPGTWMEAKVSFSDLDLAVGNGPGKGKWKAYRGNRTGEVTFIYAVLSCMRPWFSPGIYEADDWKFEPDATLVSKGNGSEGLLPAFVDAVYLVSIKDITSGANSKPRKPRRLGRKASLASVGSASFVARKGPVLSTRLSTGTVKMSVMKRVSSSALAQARNTTVPLKIANIGYAKANLGKIRKISTHDISMRLSIAHMLLNNLETPASSASDTSKSNGIYAAGFGCKRIPYAPNPNMNYKWT